MRPTEEDERVLENRRVKVSCDGDMQKFLLCESALIKNAFPFHSAVELVVFLSANYSASYKAMKLFQCLGTGLRMLLASSSACIFVYFCLFKCL